MPDPPRKSTRANRPFPASPLPCAVATPVPKSAPSQPPAPPMHTTAAAPTGHEYLAERPGFPAKTIVAALFVGAFFGYLNDTLLNIALTPIMHDFAVDKTTVQWLTTGFLLVMGAFTPITASLIQWAETRKMVLITQATFLAGSLICACAPTFAVLIAGRLVQAVSAACFVPLLFTVAPAIGPTISGLIIDHSHWRVLFAFTMPFILAAMLLVGKYLTVNLSDISRPKIDLPSAILSIAGFGGLVYACSNFAHLGAATFAALALGALLLIGVFARRQHRIDVPLLNLRAFGYAQFRYSVIILASVSFLFLFLFLGLELLLPIYTQQVLLLSGTITGLILLPASIAEAVAAPLLGNLLDRKGGRYTVLPATILLTALLAVLWLLLRLETQVLALSATFTLITVAGSACVTGETHGLNALPKALNPHGAAIIATLNPIAGAIGAAYFIGATNIGEKLTTAATAQQTMLGGIRLAVGSALILAATTIWLASKLQPNRAESPQPQEPKT